MYTISKVAADFVAIVNGLDATTLQNEIWINVNITTLFYGVATQNDNANIDFLFESEPSGAEKTELDSIIAAHTGKPTPLTALQQEVFNAKKEIDDCAGDARARYITISPGQSAVYIEKEKQSQTFKDSGYPADETGYEFVTAEKNAQGVSSTVAADTVLAMAGGWKLLAATIEETRLSYKNQVAAAPDVNTVIALKNKARAILNSI